MRLLLVTCMLASAVAFASGAEPVQPILNQRGKIPLAATQVVPMKFAIVTLAAPQPARGTAVVTNGFVTSIAMTSGGAGYVTPPAVAVTGGGGAGAKANAVVANGRVVRIEVRSAGSGYSSAPNVAIAPPPLKEAVATTLWSNDGTSVGGSEPAAPVQLQVSGGTFSAMLGYTGIPGMLALPAEVALASDARVRVWYGTPRGFVRLPTDEPLAAVPYADESLYAQTAGAVAPGSLTTAAFAPDALTSLSNRVSGNSATSFSFTLDGTGDAVIGRGFPTFGAAQELGIRNTSADNVAYFQNLDSHGYSAITMRDSQGYECTAYGIGNKDISLGGDVGVFNDWVYLEVSDAMSERNQYALGFEIVQTTNYGPDSGLNMTFHPRLRFERDGTIRFFRRDSSFSNGGTPIVTVDRDAPILTLGGYGWDNKSTWGEIRGVDENHAAVFHESNLNVTSIHEFGGTLDDGAGFKVFTGGPRASQTVKLQVADDRTQVANVLNLKPQALPANPKRGDLCLGEDMKLRLFDGSAWVVFATAP